MKKITVLFVDAAVEFGGSLTVIGNLVESIDTRCFRPIVIGEVDVDLMRNFIKSDVHIYRVPRIYNYKHWFRTLDIIKRLPGCLLRKLANYLFSAVRSAVNVLYLVRISLITLRERVDVVHVSNGMYNLAPILCAILLGRKFVVHIHGMEKPGFVHKILINKVSKFITISNYMKDGLVANGYPEKRMVVIPNPVRPRPVAPEEISELRKRYCISRHEQVVGIVGRITRWKGHVEFLSAMNVVMQSAQDLKVLIVGDFSEGNTLYKKQLTRLIENSVYRNRIILTGYVSNVEKYYNLMDVCVHASVEPEPFGLVITEAMACGVPVIASDRGAPSEIITTGENGFIVNPEATQMLAKTILHLLKDDVLRRKIGASGKEHVLRDYQPNAYAHSMEQIYMEVLGKFAKQIIPTNNSVQK